MIMINENWEQVKDLSNVLRIVSENIGSEFAQKVEEIDKLEKYIDDNLDGTDFMEGMRKAFEMIER